MKELVLNAQDTTKYGVDLYGSRKLLELLQRLHEIDGFHWIRILYMYPDEIDDELIEGWRSCLRCSLISISRCSMRMMRCWSG